MISKGEILVDCVRELVEILFCFLLVTSHQVETVQSAIMAFLALPFEIFILFWDSTKQKHKLLICYIMVENRFHTRL